MHQNNLFCMLFAFSWDPPTQALSSVARCIPSPDSPPPQSFRLRRLTYTTYQNISESANAQNPYRGFAHGPHWRTSVPRTPWVTTYTWFQKVQDVGFARPPTDHALFHAHTTHLATEALLLPGHVFGTACQHTCATKTLLSVPLL